MQYLQEVLAKTYIFGGLKFHIFMADMLILKSIQLQYV